MINSALLGINSHCGTTTALATPAGGPEKGLGKVPYKEKMGVSISLCWNCRKLEDVEAVKADNGQPFSPVRKCSRGVLESTEADLLGRG